MIWFSGTYNQLLKSAGDILKRICSSYSMSKERSAKYDACMDEQYDVTFMIFYVFFVSRCKLGTFLFFFTSCFIVFCLMRHIALQIRSRPGHTNQPNEPIVSR